MSTQYDSIQAPYDYIRTKTIALIEHENVHTTIAPFIKDASVLEFAYGAGFYTSDFLEWGASFVVGVDLSHNMLEEARRNGEKRDVGKERAHKGRQIRPRRRLPANDIRDWELRSSLGAWFLNYAPNRVGLVDMFRNICMNLRPGGHFISVTCPPTSKPSASMRRMSMPVRRLRGRARCTIMKSMM